LLDFQVHHFTTKESRDVARFGAVRTTGFFFGGVAVLAMFYLP
jgi:hypothetical protein